MLKKPNKLKESCTYPRTAFFMQSFWGYGLTVF
jgi:hypothetical protein